MVFKGFLNRILIFTLIGSAASCQSNVNLPKSAVKSIKTTDVCSGRFHQKYQPISDFYYNYTHEISLGESDVVELRSRLNRYKLLKRNSDYLMSELLQDTPCVADVKSPDKSFSEKHLAERQDMTIRSVKAIVESRIAEYETRLEMYLAAKQLKDTTGIQFNLDVAPVAPVSTPPEQPSQETDHEQSFFQLDDSRTSVTVGSVKIALVEFQNKLDAIKRNSPLFEYMGGGAHLTAYLEKSTLLLEQLAVEGLDQTQSLQSWHSSQANQGLAVPEVLAEAAISPVVPQLAAVQAAALPMEELEENSQSHHQALIQHQRILLQNRKARADWLLGSEISCPDNFEDTPEELAGEKILAQSQFREFQVNFVIRKVKAKQQIENRAIAICRRLNIAMDSTCSYINASMIWDVATSFWNFGRLMTGLTLSTIDGNRGLFGEQLNLHELKASYHEAIEAFSPFLEIGEDSSERGSYYYLGHKYALYQRPWDPIE